VVEIVEQRGGLVVIPPAGAAQYSHGSSLRTVGRCVTGVVVLAVPATPAALAAAALCPIGHQ
jgi:hypothetical protein